MEELLINCPCNNSKYEKDKIIKCGNCECYQHKNCISPMDKSEIYICPLCQLSLFDPYLKIKFHFLIPTIIKNDEQGLKSFKFNLENSIFNMDPPNKDNFLILRCLKLTEEGFCVEWPDKIDLYINNNNKIIYSVNQRKDKYKRQIYEQLAFPIFPIEKEIIHFKKFIGQAFDYFKINEENEIIINFKKTEKKKYSKYIISLDYIEYINNVEEIMKEVKFIEDTNILIQLTKCYNINLEKINFIDPISKTDIIEVPARGWKCEHISCFELKNFFYMQIKNSRFCCPICNKKVGLIYIDGIILKTIESYKNEYEAIKINGKYEIIMLKN